MNFLERIVYWSDQWAPIFRWVEQGRAEWFKKKFPLNNWFGRAGLLLDIGSGVGDVTRAIQSSTGGMVVGIDNVDYRRVGNKAGAPNLYLIGDGSSLPFKSNSFDAVTLIWVLHHVRNPLLLLTEAFRVSKENGSIIILEDLVDEDARFRKLFVKAYDRIINLELSDHGSGNLSLGQWNAMISSNFSVEVVELESISTPASLGLLKFGLLRYLKR